MNRQMRRATEKSDKKKEQEQEKRTEARRQRRRERRATSSSKPAPTKNAETSKTEASVEETFQEKGSPRLRGSARFSGFMALFTAFFILFGAVAREPASDNPQSLSVFVDAVFYLFLGYFSTMWLLRRDVKNALLVACSSGVVIVTVAQVLRFFVPGTSPEVMIIILAVPGILLGAWLAKLISARAS